MPLVSIVRSGMYFPPTVTGLGQFSYPGNQLFDPTLPNQEIDGKIKNPVGQVNRDLPKPYMPRVRQGEDAT